MKPETKEAINLADAIEELNARRRCIDYNTIDLTVERLVRLFEAGELVISGVCQGEQAWNEQHKTRFIESVLIGLPIPVMFFGAAADRQLEIIDGSQRTKTLQAFLRNEHILGRMTQLPRLQGLCFRDLPTQVRRRLEKTPVRVIILSEKVSEDMRLEIYERVNSRADM